MYEMKFQRKNLHRHDVVVQDILFCLACVLSALLLSSCIRALESDLICVDEPRVGQLDDGIATLKIIVTSRHSRNSDVSATLCNIFSSSTNTNFSSSS